MMCGQHSNVEVWTRMETTDWFCLRHRRSMRKPGDRYCPYSTDDDDWCVPREVVVWHPVGVDECIAPIVDALNKAGTFTVASCCGHGTQDGSIVLRDGREIRIGTYEANVDG